MGGELSGVDIRQEGNCPDTALCEARCLCCVVHEAHYVCCYIVYICGRNIIAFYLNHYCKINFYLTFYLK